MLIGELFMLKRVPIFEFRVWEHHLLLINTYAQKTKFETMKLQRRETKTLYFQVYLECFQCSLQNSLAFSAHWF